MSREVPAVTLVPKPIVLVWQSYGNIRVCRAETIGDLTAILAEISNTVAGWGDDERLDETARFVKMFVEKQNLERARREIRSYCSRHTDHESFEAFEFTNIEELS